MRMTHLQWTMLNQNKTGIKPKKKTKKTGRNKQKFNFYNGKEIVFSCEALTKSEARSLYKKEHNVTRVPVDILCKEG